MLLQPRFRRPVRVIGPIPDTPPHNNSFIQRYPRSVEVLTGNQSEPNQTRRRSDRRESDQRALKWFVRNGDITLFPHSPLALADVLSADNGSFDLIARSESDSTLADAAEPTETNKKSSATS